MRADVMLVFPVLVACDGKPRTDGETPPSTREEPPELVFIEESPDMAVKPVVDLEVVLNVGPSEWTATCRRRTTANELRVPVDRMVQATIESDVTMILEVPAFRMRREVVAGHAERVWFQATKTGQYPVLITRQGEGREIGSVIVLTPKDFEREF